MRSLTAYIAIFALLIQSALAPVALAGPKPKPTSAPIPAAESSEEQQVRDAAAELDKKIDKSAASKEEAAEAHATSHLVMEEIIRLQRKGLLVLKGVTPADWFRYALTGFKATYKFVEIGKTENWNNGGWPSGAGGASMLTGAAIEILATAFEFDINERTNNWPIDARKLPEHQFWKRFFIQSTQGAFWRSLLYSGIIPTSINLTNAANDAWKPYPQLVPSLMGWGTGFMLSWTYGLGYLGSGFLENRGYLPRWVRNVGFALSGMVGYYAGLKMLNGGDLAAQIEVLKMLGAVSAAYVGLGAVGILADKLAERREEKPTKKPPPHKCAAAARRMAWKKRRK